MASRKLGVKARYRMIYPAIWRNRGFRSLKPQQQVLAFYILAGPQTNRIGLFCLSIGAAAEDLDTSHGTLSTALSEVTATFGWRYDAEARVIFIPSWWTWNHPQNADHLKGNLTDLNELPETALLEAFAANIETLHESLRDVFVDVCTQVLDRSSGRGRGRVGHQELELDLEREQKSGTGTGAGDRAESDIVPGGTVNGRHQEPIALARQVLQFTNGPIEHLLDAFWSLSPSSLRCSKPDAIAALNKALAERRSA